MSKDRTEEKTISRVELHGTSTNGNPTYDVVFTDGTSARTQTDGSVGYEINNPEWRQGPILVTFTPAGRIRYVNEIKGN